MSTTVLKPRKLNVKSNYTMSQVIPYIQNMDSDTVPYIQLSNYTVHNNHNKQYIDNSNIELTSNNYNDNGLLRSRYLVHTLSNVDSAHTTNGDTESLLNDHTHHSMNNQLSQRLLDDINKVNEHLLSQVAIVQSKLDAMSNSVNITIDDDTSGTQYHTLYDTCISLQAYAATNYTATVSIINQHNLSALTSTLNGLELCHQSTLNKLIQQIELRYATQYTNHNVTIARSILLSNYKSAQLYNNSSLSKLPDWQNFQLGIRIGFLLLLFCWTIWDIIVDSYMRPVNEQTTWVQSVLPVYRGIGCCVIFGWLWSVQLYIWSKYKIKYLYLFGVSNIKPHYFSVYECVQEMTYITIVYLANFLIYFKILRGDLPPFLPSGYFPIMLYLYMCYKLLPFTRLITGNYTRDTQLTSADVTVQLIWGSLISLVSSPFSTVTFANAYIGDVLTSFVRPLVDLSYTTCLFISFDWTHDDTLIAERPERCFQSISFKQFIVPLLSAAPLWFRFAQCIRRYYDTHDRFPHLANAMKYALSHSVVLVGILHTSYTDGDQPLTIDNKEYWIICLLASTIYNFAWDVYMDWGLGKSQYHGLRERMIYDNSTIYYCAILIDLFMRFSWTLTLLPHTQLYIIDDQTTKLQITTVYDWLIIIQPILAFAELIRRSMWSCIRIEYEYIVQSDQLKKIELSSPANSVHDLNALKKSYRSGWRVLAEVITMVTGVVLTAFIAAMTAN